MKIVGKWMDQVRRRVAIVRAGDGYEKAERRAYERVADYTATGIGRVVGLIDAVRYLCENRVEGDFVECGVWKGGSIMAILSELIQYADTSRSVHLFDTFTGMTPPQEMDRLYDGRSAERLMGQDKWCQAGLEEVRANVLSTGYPKEKLHLVAGRVEDTLPGQAPEKIALLRLDTDWHQSTRHELNCLYPRLVKGGILIIDDYGHWLGARKAVEDYFNSHPPKPFLARLDYTGRIAVKPG